MFFRADERLCVFGHRRGRRPQQPGLASGTASSDASVVGEPVGRRSHFAVFFLVCLRDFFFQSRSHFRKCLLKFLSTSISLLRMGYTWRRRQRRLCTTERILRGLCGACGRKRRRWRRCGSGGSHKCAGTNAWLRRPRTSSSPAEKPRGSFRVIGWTRSPFLGACDRGGGATTSFTCTRPEEGEVAKRERGAEDVQASLVGHRFKGDGYRAQSDARSYCGLALGRCILPLASRCYSCTADPNSTLRADHNCNVVAAMLLCNSW